MAEGGENKEATQSSMSGEIDGPQLEQNQLNLQENDENVVYDIPIDFDKEYHYKPTVHPGQAVVKAGHHIILWGEDLEKKGKLDIYNSWTNKWDSPVHIEGQPPLGVRYCSVSSLDNNRVYFFGGYNEKHESYHNNVHELDIANLNSPRWKEVLPSGNKDNHIQRKIRSAMFCVRLINEGYALIVGGKVFQKPDIAEKKPTTYTNECHIVNLTNGKILKPKSIQGSVPPPSCFQLVPLVSSDQQEPNAQFKAIAYGGETEDGLHKDVYIVEIDNETNLIWAHIPSQKNHWPKRRRGYAICPFPLPSQSFLLVSGCRKTNSLLKECWVFNYNNKQWCNIGFPDQLVERVGHSVVAWAVTPNCVRVAVIGGTSANGELVQQLFATFEIYIGPKPREFLLASVNLDSAKDCRQRFSESYDKRQLKKSHKEELEKLEKERIEQEKQEKEIELKLQKQFEENKGQLTLQYEKVKKEKEEEKNTFEGIILQLGKDKDLLFNEKKQLKENQEQLTSQYEKLKKEKEEEKNTFEGNILQLEDLLFNERQKLEESQKQLKLQYKELEKEKQLEKSALEEKVLQLETDKTALSNKIKKLEIEQEELTLKYKELEKGKREEKKISEKELTNANEKLERLKEMYRKNELEKKRLLRELLAKCDEFDAVIDI